VNLHGASQSRRLAGSSKQLAKPLKIT